MRGIDPITGVGATQGHVRHRRAPRWRGPTGAMGVIVVIINRANGRVIPSEGTGVGGGGLTRVPTGTDTINVAVAVVPPPDAA